MQIYLPDLSYLLPFSPGFKKKGLVEKIIMSIKLIILLTVHSNYLLDAAII